MNPLTRGKVVTIVLLPVAIAIIASLAAQRAEHAARLSPVYQVSLPQYRTAVEAENAALAELARMLSRRPGKDRYVVVYLYDGRHFGGHVPKSLSYNPASQRLLDQFDASLEATLWRDITKSDVVAAARLKTGLQRLQGRPERIPSPSSWMTSSQESEHPQRRP